MLVGDTVAGTTYVGRHVAVLLATKEVGSGWFTGGAPALRCYSFVIFSRGVQTRESVRDLDSLAMVVVLNQYFAVLFSGHLRMHEG